MAIARPLEIDARIEGDRATLTLAEGWRALLIRPLRPTLSSFQVTRAEESLLFVDGPVG